MKTKAIMKKLTGALVIMCTALCVSGCSGTNPNPGNMPYEPDTPAPDPHDGVFESEHGTMTFNGDGETVIIDFDAELSEKTGLPEGEQEGTYVFLSGNLPPNGSVDVRYDVAHEVSITIGDTTSVIPLGIASEDGNSATAGFDMVTPKRIPFLFDEDKFVNVIFEKKS